MCIRDRGKSYHDIQQQLKKIEQEISKVQADLKKVENSGIIEAVDDAFTQERKDAAMWAKSTTEADALLRDRCEKCIRDSYATEPRAMELLLAEEHFAPVIWECACGEGHLSKVLEQHGFEVISTDLIYRGFGDPEPLDFLKETLDDFEGDIITNPPYKYALECVEQAWNSVQPGRKVAMFLKLQFLEGKSRKQFFLHNPPKTVYVSSDVYKRQA